MATEEKDLKIIPRDPLGGKESVKRTSSKQEYLGIKSPEIIICIAMFIAYLILISLLTYLPITLLFKILSLLIGSFIIADILQIIKRRMFED